MHHLYVGTQTHKAVYPRLLPRAQFVVRALHFTEPHLQLLLACCCRPWARPPEQQVSDAPLPSRPIAAIILAHAANHGAAEAVAQRAEQRERPLVHRSAITSAITGSARFTSAILVAREVEGIPVAIQRLLAAVHRPYLAQQCARLAAP